MSTVRWTRSGKRGRDGGLTDGVEGMASRARTRRRRPAASVTASGQQRPEQQKTAATSRGHSRTTIRQGRPSDDSSVALSSQRRHTRTAIRQLVRFRNSSVTLRRKTHSDNSNKRLLWLLSFTANMSHSTTRAQFQYTSTRLLTLTDSQAINTPGVLYAALSHTTALNDYLSYLSRRPVYAGT